MARDQGTRHVEAEPGTLEAPRQVLSSWVNGSNTRSMSASGMPMPVSRTNSSSLPSACSEAPTDTVPPASVNFTAFDSRWLSACCSRLSSARIGGRSSGTSATSVISAACAAASDWRTQRRIRRADVDPVGGKIEAARLDARHVEDDVDQLRAVGGQPR